VLNINFLFYANFAIFSIFAAMIITELMGSILLLLNWKKYREPVLEYVVPVWEITGTFGAFWVVTADFAYPPILIPVASIFSFAIMVFLILFVARNSTISFAEFIRKRGWLDDRKLYVGYALSSIFLGLVLLVILSGIIGGNGVNLSAFRFSSLNWLYQPSGYLFIIGALLLMVGFAPVFYRVPSLSKLSLLFVAFGIIVSTLSFAMFRNWTLSPYVLVSDVIAILIPILYNVKNVAAIVSNKIVFISLLSVDIFSLNFMVYPTAFGGVLRVDSITNTGLLESSFIVLTVVGAIIVAALIALYAIAVARKVKEPSSIRF
jgi:cytochrome d ubiquinol oxidase subunit II